MHLTAKDEGAVAGSEFSAAGNVPKLAVSAMVQTNHPWVTHSAAQHIQKICCVTYASISARSIWLFYAALDVWLWQVLTWSSATVWPSAVQ